MFSRSTLKKSCPVFTFFFYFFWIGLLRYYDFPLLLDKIPGINRVESKKLAPVMDLLVLEDYVSDLVLSFIKGIPRRQKMDTHGD